MSPSNRPPDARAGDRTAARTGAAVWIVVAVSTLVFLAFAYFIGERQPLPFDAAVLAWLHQHASPPLTSVARDLSAIGEPTVVGPITLIVTLLLLLFRRWRRALLMALEVGGAAVLDKVLKPLFARPRPTLYPHLVPETNYSFPSGHAVGDLAFAMALFLVVGTLIRGRWRSLGYLSIGLALLIGASRPYLQVHYPSDVLAGWALGLAWVLAVHELLAAKLHHRAPHARSG